MTITYPRFWSMKMETIRFMRHPEFADVCVTEDGRIFQEVQATDAHTYGYQNVVVRRAKGSGVRMRRAEIVCEAFHGARPAGNVVRHLDGNTANDAALNLAWGTPKDNSSDMVRHGKSQRGEKNTFAKISQETAAEIKRRVLAGEGVTAVARSMGVKPQLCCDIKMGRSWAWLDV